MSNNLRVFMVLVLLSSMGLFISCADQDKHKTTGETGGPDDLFKDNSPSAQAPAGEGCCNNRCPMTGVAFDAATLTPAMVREFEGQKVGFCCPGCPGKWDKMMPAEKRVALGKARPCVNTHCPVTGRRLQPAVLAARPELVKQVNDRSVGFCGVGCQATFEKLSDQEKEKAVEKATVSEIANTHCPISGAKLDASNLNPDLVREFEGKKIGLCCKGCVDEWEKLSPDQKRAALKKVEPKE